MSKLSDKCKREVLVVQLIAKINNEINQFIKNAAENLMSFENDIEKLGNENDDQNDFIELCNEVTICNWLRNFINRPYAFMETYAVSSKNDFITYVISDKHIDMWLEDDFHFVMKVIFAFGTEVFFQTERSFEFGLCTLIEDSIYEDKLKKSEAAAGKGTNA